MHRIAITQLSRPGPAKEYMAKRLAAGNTKTEAIRALKRRVSDEVYRRLLQDERASSTSDVTACVAAA
jgi:hypothetical protein